MTSMRTIGLIERHRDRLPFEADDPIVTLGEGSTPLVLAERLSERVADLLDRSLLVGA